MKSVRKQASSQDFFMGGAYLKNPDQIITVGMIYHVSSKDTRVLGGSSGIHPCKNLKFEVLKLLEMHWGCQSNHHQFFVSF